MATVSKKIADKIIAGMYSEDIAFKIVKYFSPEGEENYGVMFKGDDPNKYHASEWICNPSVYWEKIPSCDLKKEFESFIEAQTMKSIEESLADLNGTPYAEKDGTLAAMFYLFQYAYKLGQQNAWFGDA